MKPGILQKATMFVRNAIVIVVAFCCFLLALGFILLMLYDMFTEFDYRQLIFDLREKLNSPRPQEITKTLTDVLRHYKLNTLFQRFNVTHF